MSECVSNISAEAVARFLGKLSAGLFAGSCIYGTCVHQPAILDHDDKGTNDAFIAMFKRAAPTQIAYTLISAASSLYVYNLHREEKALLYSAGLLIAIAPYTKFAMMPTNNALNGVPEKLKSLEAAGEILNNEEAVYKDAKQLVKKWGKLHLVRSVIGIAAFSFLIYKA